MKHFYSLLIIAAFFCCPLGLDAQCTVHQIDNHPGSVFKGDNDRVGQTFIPCEDGIVESVSFVIVGDNSLAPSSSSNGNYEFYLGEDSGNVILPGAPLRTFVVNNALPFKETITIDLTATPFLVETAKEYRFEIVNTSVDYRVGNAIGANGDYLDGVLVTQGDNALPTVIKEPEEDLDFQVSIIKALPIPTMGEWSLFLFGLIVLTLGVVTLYSLKRQTQAKKA